MVKDCYSTAENVDVLNQFFNEYKNELISHTKREDEVVFPHALKIEEAYEKGENQTELPTELKNYSIQDYMTEHDNIEEKLFDFPYDIAGIPPLLLSFATILGLSFLLLRLKQKKI